MANEETIQERNERFQKLERRDQRIVIAQDVLQRLNSGQYRPDHSYGILLNGTLGDIAAGRDDVKCQVCALGGMLMSALSLSGKGKGVGMDDEIASWGELREALGEYFDEQEMLLIELFYEGDSHAVYPVDMEIWTENWAYGHMGAKKMDGQGRMRHIMQNIVDNDGNFDAEKLMQKFPEYNG